MISKDGKDGTNRNQEGVHNSARVRRAKVAKRDARIVTLRRSSMSFARIAVEIGMPVGTVYDVCKRDCPELRTKRRYIPTIDLEDRAATWAEELALDEHDLKE